MYRKRQKLLDAGEEVAPLAPPDSPRSGWVLVTQENYQHISSEIPIVTDGLVYSYIREGTGNDVGDGSQRALERGFNHYKSRGLDVEVNTNNPQYCHTRSHIIPSMKAGTYKTYIVLERDDNNFAIVRKATCNCVAG